MGFFFFILLCGWVAAAAKVSTIFSRHVLFFLLCTRITENLFIVVMEVAWNVLGLYMDFARMVLFVGGWCALTHHLPCENVSWLGKQNSA